MLRHIVNVYHLAINDFIGNHSRISLLCCYLPNSYNIWTDYTRSSATEKSTARPSCLVGVLYDISREKSVDD